MPLAPKNGNIQPRTSMTRSKIPVGIKRKGTEEENRRVKARTDSASKPVNGSSFPSSTTHSTHTIRRPLASTSKTSLSTARRTTTSLNSNTTTARTKTSVSSSSFSSSSSISRPSAVKPTNALRRTLASTSKDPVTMPKRIPKTSNTNSTAGAKTNGSSTTAKKKRPAWDLRGKISDMEEQLLSNKERISELMDAMQGWEDKTANKETEARELHNQLINAEAMLEAAKKSHEDEMAKINESFKAKEDALDQEDGQGQQKLQCLQQEIERTREQTSDLERQRERSSTENTALRTTMERTLNTLNQVEADLHMFRAKGEQVDTMLTDLQNNIDQLENSHTETKNKVTDLESKLLESERIRRQKHNTIQELKGNIRVFCRVRPILESESDQHRMAQIDFRGSNPEIGDHSEKLELKEEVSSTLGKVSTKTYPFAFDKVFEPSCTQHECYEEISQLVQSALDGYNVCIFAYGQTGSGKTYTMQGPPRANTESAGMIPRAVQQIYDVAQKLNDRNWSYSMEGQFLEIYNENLHDLLGDTSTYGKIKHEIRHEKNGRTTVTDMTTVVLDSPAKVTSMLKKASQNRATGATNLNERSSRSHSVFMLRITGSNAVTQEHCSGVLNLIDLAGSERLALSGSTGDRLRETQAINKSLSCLGDVIHALANNKEGGHVPYRNSKLTYLLQNSLGGNSKTLMFVNVSPLSEHFGETLCSLRFATKVNSCRIGTATRKVTRPSSSSS